MGSEIHPLKCPIMFPPSGVKGISEASYQPTELAPLQGTRGGSAHQDSFQPVNPIRMGGWGPSVVRGRAVSGRNNGGVISLMPSLSSRSLRQIMPPYLRRRDRVGQDGNKLDAPVRPCWEYCRMLALPWRHGSVAVGIIYARAWGITGLSSE